MAVQKLATLNAADFVSKNVVRSPSTIEPELLTGAIGSRPAAGTADRFYWATDENIWYYDNGSTWDELTPATVTEAAVTAHEAALTIADGQIGETAVTQHEAALTIADGQIGETAVTQHEAALTILESQITDGSILARLASDEDVTGDWDLQGDIDLAGLTIFNVKHPDYGATGDGVTDDYSALDSARTAATASGGILLFPPGTYVVGTNLSIDADVECWLMPGAKLSPSSGITVTLVSGIIGMPQYQIFTGDGTIRMPDTPIVSARWWGATDDDATDCGPAVESAQAAIDYGVVWIPPANGVYYFSTGVQCASNITYRGDKTRIRNDATISGVGNNLFDLDDVSNVTIEGFIIDGDTSGNPAAPNAQQAVRMQGVVDKIVVRDCHFFDHQNFSIVYGDTDTSISTAKPTNILIEDCIIDGDCGLVGEGSGIDFLPRATNSGNPAGENLTIRRCRIDVTRGEADEADHGPQALKISNIRGVYLEDLYLRGGDIACCIVTNGCQEVFIRGVRMGYANRGITFDGTGDGHGDADEKRVFVEGLSYRQDGVTGPDAYGIRLNGELQEVFISNFDLDGQVRITMSTTGAEMKDIHFSNGKCTSFRMEDPGQSETNIEGLSVSNLRMVGGAGTALGSMILGSSNWSVDNGNFVNLTFMETDLDVIRELYGSGNIFRNITILDGNPDNDGSRTAIFDHGDNNVFDGVALVGTHNLDWILRRSADGVTRIKNVTGAGTDTDGVNFSSCTDRILGDRVIMSVTLDLSAASTTGYYYAAAGDAYVLSVTMLYAEASSADAGVALRVGNGTNASNILSQTSEVSKALGYTKTYVNDSDFTTRQIAKGERLSMGTAGGKTGAGEVVIIVDLLEGITS